MMTNLATNTAMTLAGNTAKYMAVTLASSAIVVYPSGPPPGRFDGMSLESDEDQVTRRRKLTVLVVDDEGLIADSVAEILNGSGYDAAAVYSGESAVEAARRLCPDIVMTDVLMPRMNGVETALAIHSICPSTLILLFSGQAATVDLLQQARDARVEFEVLPKPIHPEQLLKKLKSLHARA